MMWYASVHELFLSFFTIFSSHQSDLRWCWFNLTKEFFQKLCTCFLAKSNLGFLFMSITNGLGLMVNPLFSFMKMLLNCRHWQWWISLKVFMTLLNVVNNGKNSVIIHFSCLLWSFGPFLCCSAVQCIHAS